MSIRLEGDEWVVRFPARASKDVLLEEALLEFYQEKFAIMTQRHRKYGPGNIAASGFKGLVTRIKDKVARLEHGLGEMPDEPWQDTIIDLGNYADIMWLWENEKWPQAATQPGLVRPSFCEGCGREM